VRGEKLSTVSLDSQDEQTVLYSERHRFCTSTLKCNINGPRCNLTRCHAPTAAKDHLLLQQQDKAIVYTWYLFSISCLLSVDYTGIGCSSRKPRYRTMTLRGLYVNAVTFKDIFSFCRSSKIGRENRAKMGSFLVESHQNAKRTKYQKYTFYFKANSYEPIEVYVN